MTPAQTLCFAEAHRFLAGLFKGDQGLPVTFDACTQLVRPGGTIANVGVHGRSVELKLQDLWIKANEIAHTQIVNALTGKQSGAVVTSKNGAVSLDLSSVAKLVEDKLEEQGITLFESVPMMPLMIAA